MTSFEALSLIAKGSFRPFEQRDLLGFSGVEDASQAMICDDVDDKTILIVGSVVEIYGSRPGSLPGDFELLYLGDLTQAET